VFIQKDPSHHSKRVGGGRAGPAREQRCLEVWRNYTWEINICREKNFLLWWSVFLSQTQTTCL